VQGELRSRSYTTDGYTVTTYEIIASSTLNLRAGQRNTAAAPVDGQERPQGAAFLRGPCRNEREPVSQDKTRILSGVPVRIVSLVWYFRKRVCAMRRLDPRFPTAFTPRPFSDNGVAISSRFRASSSEAIA
jgi:hypothetical protein